MNMNFRSLVDGLNDRQFMALLASVKRRLLSEALAVVSDEDEAPTTIDVYERTEAS